MQPRICDSPKRILSATSTDQLKVSHRCRLTAITSQKKERTSVVGSEIHFNDDQHYLQGTWGIFSIGRPCENKAVLPTVEQSVAGMARGRHLIGATHDEERDQRIEFPGEVVIGIFDVRLLVCDDQYLANDMFQREGGRLLMVARPRIFLQGASQKTSRATILLTTSIVKPL